MNLSYRIRESFVDIHDYITCCIVTNYNELTMNLSYRIRESFVDIHDYITCCIVTNYNELTRVFSSLYQI